jgi:VanZ family protein
VSERQTVPRSRIGSLLRVALVLYWLAMFVATHWPNVHLERYPRFFDKVLHFGGYAGLGLLLPTYLSTRRDVSPRVLAAILGLVFVYAVADELLQIPVGRTCDALDALADLAGCCVGLAVFVALRRIVRRFAAA